MCDARAHGGKKSIRYWSIKQRHHQFSGLEACETCDRKGADQSASSTTDASENVHQIG